MVVAHIDQGDLHEAGRHLVANQETFEFKRVQQAVLGHQWRRGSWSDTGVLS